MPVEIVAREPGLSWLEVSALKSCPVDVHDLQDGRKVYIGCHA